MFERWLTVALEEAGVADVDAALLSSEAVTVILDLARDAARGVDRPAAPLATFAAGFALGRGGSFSELQAAAARISVRAGTFREEEGATTGETPAV